MIQTKGSRNELRQKRKGEIEMPGNSIQELYKQIKDTRSSANGEDYQKYLQAMELLNTELHGLIEPGPDGWKLLDAERMKALAKCYREAGEWAEVYLYKTRETKDPADRRIRGTGPDHERGGKGIPGLQRAPRHGSDRPHPSRAGGPGRAKPGPASGAAARTPARAADRELNAERSHLVLAAQGGCALSGGQRTERHRFRRILYRRD